MRPEKYRGISGRVGREHRVSEVLGNSHLHGLNGIIRIFYGVDRYPFDLMRQEELIDNFNLVSFSSYRG